MASTPLFVPFSLSPLDHLAPGVYTSMLIVFKATDPASCVAPLEIGINGLVRRMPFLTGHIVTVPEVDGKKNIVQVHPPATCTDAQILQVKHHHASLSTYPHLWAGAAGHGTKASNANFPLCPLPPLLPRAARKPAIAFLANVFTDGLALAVSFNHSLLDGCGVSIVWEALEECCREAQPDKGSSMTDHQNELRDAIFNAPDHPSPPADHNVPIDTDSAPLSADISPEAIAAMASSTRTCRLVFPAARVQYLKDRCSTLQARHYDPSPTFRVEQ